MLVIGGENIYASCFFREQLLSQLLLLAESHFGWALFAVIPNNDKSFSSAEASRCALSIFPLLQFLLRYPAGAFSFSNMPLVLDTVHVTSFVQSRHCRWRTDSFTFVLVVSSIFAVYQVIFDYLFGKVWVDRCSKPQFLKQYNVSPFVSLTAVVYAFQSICSLCSTTLDLHF